MENEKDKMKGFYTSSFATPKKDEKENYTTLSGDENKNTNKKETEIITTKKYKNLTKANKPNAITTTENNDNIDFGEEFILSSSWIIAHMMFIIITLTTDIPLPTYYTVQILIVIVFTILAIQYFTNKKYFERKRKGMKTLAIIGLIVNISTLLNIIVGAILTIIASAIFEYLGI